MDPTITPKSRRWKSRTRGAGCRAVRLMTGAASDEAAKKQIDRHFANAESTLQLLVMNGASVTAFGHIQRCMEILEGDQDLGPSLNDDLLMDGAVSRARDGAREACLAGGATPAELALFISRSRRETVEIFRNIKHAIRALEARSRG